MKNLILAAAAICMFAAASIGQTNPPAASTALKIGDTAPDFTLSDTAGTKVKLSDLRGKSNVVLAFYVFAFTGG